MGDSALEALRLQALQSLKHKKPAPPSVAPVVVITDGNLSGQEKTPPNPNRNISGPIVEKAPQRQQPKKAKKSRKERAVSSPQVQQQRLVPKIPALPVGQSGLDPSTLFSMFTNKIVAIAGNVGHGPAQPPPMPSSFHLAATRTANVSAPVSRKDKKPLHVIDLDSTDDDKDQDGLDDAHQMQTDVIPELTRPVISSPEPGEIILDSSEEQTKAQTRLNLIKASLEEVDRAYFQNEDLIGSAVKKQNEFKAKARQYRALVKKGKVMKKELYQKKSELLYQLTRAKQAFALCDHQRSSPLVTSPMLLTPIVIGPTQPALLSPAMFSPVEADEKRKAEYEELQRQLNKVQQDLEQSKLSLIKTKSQKAEMRRVKNTEREKTRNPIKKSPRIESPSLVKQRNLLAGTEVVLIEGSLYPLSMIVALWDWIQSMHPPMKSTDKETTESNLSPEYESPLRWFKSSIFFDHFLDFVSKKGLLSSTFANKIDPMMPFCKAQFDYGCTDKNCMFQHLDQVQLGHDALLESLIQRLLELTPKEMFESKADVLQFIHEKLSEKDLKGVPIVTLVTRLLELKKEISEEPVFVKGLHSGGHDASGPIDKKASKTTMKNFISTASSMPGRCFFELSKDQLRGESRGYKRYYCLADEEETTGSELELFIAGCPEIGTSDEDRQAFLTYLCNYQTEIPSIQLLCLDLASSISRCPLTSCPEESLSKPMLWLSFYLTNSFHLRCALTNRLLACLDGSFELINLILGLAKCAIDAGLTTEVNALFLAILKSQMSITADDIIPCAQLCTLGFELDLEAKIRLWLFYLEYLHTNSYASEWFCAYPYDASVDYEFKLIGSFANASLFDMTKKCLLHLLEDAVAVGNEEARVWIAYNLVGVNLETNMALDIAIQCGPSSMAKLLKLHLSIPDESCVSSPISVLLQARSLSLHGLKKMSNDLIQNWIDTGDSGVDQFSLLLNSLDDSEKLTNLVNRNDGLLFRLGKAVLFRDPVRIHLESCETVLHRVIPCNEDGLEMVKAKQTTRYLVDSDHDLESLCDKLLSNPGDSRLWQRLIPLMAVSGLDQCMPAVKEIAARYSVLSCTDH